MRRRAGFAAIGLLAFSCMIGSMLADPPSSPVRAAAPATPPATAAPSVVLILGDSLALCGFGKRLDQHFREHPELAKAVYSYMACATHPLSWLKDRPYGTVVTRCGFWSIESEPEGRVKELPDVYGMRRGSVPHPHPVPKLDDLLAQHHPDVLIMQTGGNLFDLFHDKKTTKPETQSAELKKFVAPFISRSAGSSSPLRKIYWVAPPTSGRVSKQVQDFIVEEVRNLLGPFGSVIDSRPLVRYPYRHMEPDKEHFIGEDMDEWADKVFEQIRADMTAHPIAALKPLHELAPIAAVPGPSPVATPAAVAVAMATPAPTPNAEPSANKSDVLEVQARLVFKSKPMRVEEFLPYRESMVAYLYDVTKVLNGHYDDKQILVLHPSYIGLHRQSLRKYHIGRTYKLTLQELEDTPWSTVKRRDDTARMDLEPYIRVEDEARYPNESH